ncbi:MAG: ribosomal protein S18-alanine N-acetyltransferase [Candidatus Njordarchaeota archaeon]
MEKNKNVSERYDEIILRRAKTTDLDQIAEIENLSFIEPYSKELLLMLILSVAIFLVAEYHKKIVGYICASIEIYDGPCGHIISIAVHPNYRRKGIGSALIKELINRLKKIDIKMVYLECRVSNEAAIEFYKKHGFEIKERVPHYYSNSEDAYIMIKRFDDQINEGHI